MVTGKLLTGFDANAIAPARKIEAKMTKFVRRPPLLMVFVARFLDSAKKFGSSVWPVTVLTSLLAIVDLLPQGR